MSEKQKEMDEAVAKVWNENAAGWARSLRGGMDEFRTLVLDPNFARFVGDVKGKRVLDAGCGEGDSSRILARNGAKVAAVDISDAMLELACGEEAREPLGIEYAKASMADLSIFPDRSFDAVVSTMAVMNSASLAEEFREFLRVLRPGGMFAFSVRHPCFATPAARVATDTEAKRAGLLVGEYFRDTPWTQKVPLTTPGGAPAGHFTAFRFPYTVSRYVNEMIGAGFAVTGVEEPRPSAEDCKGRDWLGFWRTQAALYLFLKGVKPAER